VRRLLPVALAASALVLLAAAPARAPAGHSSRHGLTQVDRRVRGAYDAAYRQCFRQAGRAVMSDSLLVERAAATAALLAPQRDRLAASRGCTAGRAAAEYDFLQPPTRRSAP
jgi:hypothetical protein